MHIASYDWDHAGWCGTYYPDDLPPEWRLAYYANEFAAVVVPAWRWRAATPAMVGQWLADTGEGFRFLLEQADVAPSLELQQMLGDRYGGLTDNRTAYWSGGAEPRALRDVIVGLPEDGVLVVAGTPPSIEALRVAQTITQLLGC